MWMITWLACDSPEQDSAFELDFTETASDTASVDSEDTAETSEEDTAADTNDNSLMLVGTWEDVFGDVHVVTESTWQNPTGLFHIAEYQNSLGRIVARNDAENPFNANKYSVFEWLTRDAQQFFCQSGLEANSLEDARLIEANRDDLETGCRGQGWKRFRSKVPIAGSYLDADSLPVNINSFRWSWGLQTYHVVDFYYDESRVIARNDQNNPISPNMWSQLAWIQNAEGTWICLVNGSGESLEAANAVEFNTDTHLQGCNDGPWTPITMQ